MTPHNLARCIYTALVIALLVPAAPLAAQGTGQQAGFYEVQLTKEEIYTYTNLKSPAITPRSCPPPAA